MNILKPILAGRGVLGPGEFLPDFGACGGRVEVLEMVGGW